MLLRRIGYWGAGYGLANGHYPNPTAFVDPSLDEEERDLVVTYLRNGVVARAYMGYAPCRLCDKRDNGNLELTDGVYLWPQGLAHYVADHSLRLPQEFVHHIDRMEEALSAARWTRHGGLGRSASRCRFGTWRSAANNRDRQRPNCSASADPVVGLRRCSGRPGISRESEPPTLR